MRRLWLLLLMALVPCAAQAQTATGEGAQQPLSVSEVTWGSSQHVFRQRSVPTGYPSVKGARGDNHEGSRVVQDSLRLRHMAVTLTNTGGVPVESVRLAFVFSDPSSGEEWFRYKSRRKTKLLPGESVTVEKVATATFGFPPRDERAKKSVVVTEIKYADGSVWKRK